MRRITNKEQADLLRKTVTKATAAASSIHTTSVVGEQALVTLAETLEERLGQLNSNSVIQDADVLRVIEALQNPQPPPKTYRPTTPTNPTPNTHNHTTSRMNTVRGAHPSAGSQMILAKTSKSSKRRLETDQSDDLPTVRKAPDGTPSTDQGNRPAEKKGKTTSVGRTVPVGPARHTAPILNSQAKKKRGILKALWSKGKGKGKQATTQL